MKTVSIYDAKTNLSKYIKAAKEGEEIHIGSFGKPEVTLNVYKEKPKTAKKRKLGVGKGKFWVAPDAFSEDTDKEIADMLTKDDLEY